MESDLRVWCQWTDLKVPQNFTLTNKPLTTMTAAERSEIQIYVPQYMGGNKALAHIQDLENVKIVQLLMAGYDDALAYMRAGVTLCNATGVHNDSTAELALALTLASLRGIPDFVRNQSLATWGHRKYPSLSDKTIGIVGYGSIGKSLAHLLSVFPVNILKFARTPKEDVFGIEELDKYLPQLDVIILLVPLTPETKKLINSKRLASLKDGALLVNVSRGGVVDTGALVAELETGRISAALDVTDPEPLPADHALWGQKNCLISPHVGGDSGAFEKRGRKLIEEQLQRLHDGEELINIIDWVSLQK